MKSISQIVAATSLILAGAAAHAQFYVEGAYMPTTIDLNGAMKLKPAALTGLVGYDVHPNLAVEGTLGLGATSGSAPIPNNNASLTAKYKSSYGVFVKPRFQATSALELFARVGYVKSKVEFSAAGYSDSGSGSSTSWGFGGNYAIDNQLYLTASYMSLYKKDGSKIDGLNMGVGYKF